MIPRNEVGRNEPMVRYLAQEVGHKRPMVRYLAQELGTRAYGTIPRTRSGQKRAYGTIPRTRNGQRLLMLSRNKVGNKSLWYDTSHKKWAQEPMVRYLAQELGTRAYGTIPRTRSEQKRAYGTIPRTRSYDSSSGCGYPMKNRQRSYDSSSGYDTPRKTDNGATIAQAGTP